MNAYDFIVGLQNYSHTVCSFIPKTDNEGLSLYFKVYKTIFEGGLAASFTNDNVNKFSNHIKIILHHIYYNMIIIY